MNLWSVRFEVEEKFKNLFSEYVEDFPGYVSNSLFINEKNFKGQVSDIFVTNNILGEFHQNEVWILETLLRQKPDKRMIKRKLNHLAKELKISGYHFQNEYTNKKYAKKLHVSKISKKNWLEHNRKSFPSIYIDNFLIFGSHINKIYSVNKIPIKIDASTAFGTGSHETTRSCIRALTLISRFSKPNRILDYGCGTGILGMASQKIFKKSQVIFVDIDKTAVAKTKENLKLNKITSKKVYLSNSYNSIQYEKKRYYSLIFANILFGPLKDLAPLFSKVLKPNSFLILSGLLEGQISYIINRYNKYGFKQKKIFNLNGWGSIIMKRRS